MRAKEFLKEGMTFGPAIYGPGRSQEQVARYIDELLELFQFAQKNNASISWG